MVMRRSRRVVCGLLVAAGLVGSGLVLSSASASGPIVTEFTTGLTAGGVPDGITKGPDGAMWFTEFKAGKIGRVSASGAVSEYPPSGQAQLSGGANPSGIVAGPDGHLWFTEYGAGKIGELDPATGDLLSETATPSANPEGIAVGSDGQLWFVENSDGRIGSIDPSTHKVDEYFPLGQHLGPPCPGAVGIVPGPGGDLWATCSSDSTVLRIDPTATQPGTTGGLISYNLPTSTAQPEGLTVGLDGTLWVAEYGADQLAEIDPSGVAAGTSNGITEYAAGGQPLLITSGGDGGLWSADHSGGQLLRFDPTSHATTALGSAAGVSGQPNGVAPDSHGNIWFTSSGTATAVGEITFTNTTSTTTSTSTTTTSRATTTTTVRHVHLAPGPAPVLSPPGPLPGTTLTCSVSPPAAGAGPHGVQVSVAWFQIRFEGAANRRTIIKRVTSPLAPTSYRRTLVLPQVPQGTEVYCEVTVTSINSGESYTQDSNTVTVPQYIPAVSSVVPASGDTAGATQVLVTGKNFEDGVTEVLFGSTPAASFKVLGDTKLQAVSPGGNVGPVLVRVVTGYGESAANATKGRFTYVAPSCPIAPYGAIGNEYVSLGGEMWGPLGCALGPEVSAGGQNGRIQRFEHGEIAFSPDQNMITAVYTIGDVAYFRWQLLYNARRQDTIYNYGKWVVIVSRAQRDGVGVEGDGSDNPRVGSSPGDIVFQVTVAPHGFDGEDSGYSYPRTQGALQYQVVGPGRWLFKVEGCDSGTFNSSCRQGWTVPVAIISPKASSFTGCPGRLGTSGEGAEAVLQRWSELGGPSTLGCPTGAARAVGSSVQQSFEHGAIESQTIDGYQDDTLAAWSYPDDPRGPRRGGRVHVSWSGGPVYFESPSLPELAGYTWRWLGDEEPNDADWHIDDYDPYSLAAGDTTFDGPNGAVKLKLCPYGGGNPCTAPLTVTSFGHAPPQLAPQRDPASAIATLGSRVQAVAATFACQSGYTGLGENPPVQMEAMLDQVATIGPAVRPGCLGEAPFQTLVNETLLDTNSEQERIGTSSPAVAGFCAKQGEYDTYLKGLVALVYRYGYLLWPATYEHVLTRLLWDHHVAGLANRLGGLNDDELHWNCGPVDVSETENHILNVTSSQYLANQLVYQAYGCGSAPAAQYAADSCATFDNARNGLTDWLLQQLQVIAKYDFLEYNARVYQRYSMSSLFNLYDFGQDASIRRAAQIVLDWTTMKFALSSSDLRRAGPFRRRTDYTDAANGFYYEMDSDPQTAFFLAWTGMAQFTQNTVPGYWYVETMLAGLSSYRPTRDAIYFAMDKSQPYEEVFYGGARPRHTHSSEDAEPGIEIYSSSPSFLLTAGGAWLNSGLGYDSFHSADIGVEQATSLLPTQLNPPYDDLIQPAGQTKVPATIRFDGRGQSQGGSALCVAGGFACGVNLQIPPYVTDCYGTQTAADASNEPDWLFVDFDRPRSGGCSPQTPRTLTAAPGKQMPALGFYLAVQSTVNGDGRIGFIYALESSKMSFGSFVSRTLADNPLLVVDNSQCCDFDYKFNSPDGHSYTFNLWSSSSDKYAPMVTAIDGVRQPSFTTFPLATGPYLSEDGHDGVLHISSPACPGQLLLNYSDWRNATISGPACHTWSVPVTAPWRSRISDRALVSSSLQQSGGKRVVAKRPKTPAPTPKPVKKRR